MAATRHTSIRAIAAIAGGAAFVTLGWLSVMSARHSSSVAFHAPPAPPTVTSASMALGATTTTGMRAPAAMATPKAHPNITGPAALPSEEAGLP
ncbi:hypothetical protein [Mycobacterium sp. DL440]|uniref:hypothetical protein n=1 Tax=Mycobacterium sp. DL440 TaxID=2675523 RepID=UPI00142267B3|nr:hypothetical protein [Mycobacterium sp. DL440]